jgi:hypothetical protein
MIRKKKTDAEFYANAERYRAQPRVVLRPELSHGEARAEVAKSHDLSSFAEALHDRLGPEANVALAERVIARSLKKRRQP